MDFFHCFSPHIWRKFNANPRPGQWRSNGAGNELVEAVAVAPVKVMVIGWGWQWLGSGFDGGRYGSGEDIVCCGNNAVAWSGGLVVVVLSVVALGVVSEEVPVRMSSLSSSDFVKTM